MSGIEMITFDLDDTLWAIAPVIERAERRLHAWLLQTCPEAGHRYNPAALRALRQEVETSHPELRGDLSGLRRRSIELALQRCKGPVERADEGFEIFWAARNEVEFYGEVKDALQRLGRRYRLAAISNGNACLQRTGLDEVFEFGLSAHAVGHMKPAAEIFLQACRTAGHPPARCLHVGDDLECDVEGALAAGMQAAWVNREQRREPLQDGVIEVRDLGELAERLAA